MYRKGFGIPTKTGHIWPIKASLLHYLSGPDLFTAPPGCQKVRDVVQVEPLHYTGNGF